MADYKNTLNLPQTDFPMRANLANREPEILKFWQEQNIYQEIRKTFAGRDKFILHDGPPYANGAIHLGHVLNKTLKDIVIKAKTLSGFDAPFIPGWDCHGLPIELNVEKQLRKIGEKVDAETFRKACREYADSQINIQRQAFIRLGVFGDWYRPYVTMDFSFEADVIRALAKIVEHGHVVRGSKPVFWCTACCSALAEAEVEYQDKITPAIDVDFTIIDAKEFSHRLSKELNPKLLLHIPIWTTTPWTLPSNECVAIHRDIEYVLLQAEKSYLIIAKELIETVTKRYDASPYQIISTFLGSLLEGLLLQHPFLDKQVPIVFGEHVTVETGTGSVSIAPVHGPEDYLLGVKYSLPIRNPLDHRSYFKAEVPFFAGKHILKVDDDVIALLKEKNTLRHIEKVSHSYPYCWRHKIPLVFLATPQWFIAMDKKDLRKEALSAIQTVQWTPHWGQARIAALVEQRPDWCISRQRTWGTPLAFIMHKETYELHPAMPALMENIAKMVEQHGVKAWYETALEELIGNDAKNYIKLNDVLDVWFDSGVTHAAVLNKRYALAYPADLYLEGPDQHRGWFQTSLLSSIGMHNQSPYRQIVTHGYTVDSQGRKMSKSLGNVIAPDEVWNHMGADILRLWVGSVDYGSAEVAVSDEVLKRTSDVYRRIRNTARFLLSNLHDFDPAKHQVELLALDAWAVEKTKSLQIEIIAAYNSYQFHHVSQKIHQFCNIDMGSFYLDIIKDRVYTMAKNSRGRRSAQIAMYHILQALVRWLAPIISFTAEEIWQHMPWQDKNSVFLTEWYQTFPQVTITENMDQAFWQRVIEIRDEVNKVLEQARNDKKIGSALAAQVLIKCQKEQYELLSKLDDELRFIVLTSEAAIQLSNVFDVEVKASSCEKCERCWHRRADRGKNPKYPDICMRCVENIAGKGEYRRFA